MGYDPSLFQEMVLDRLDSIEDKLDKLLEEEQSKDRQDKETKIKYALTDETKELLKGRLQEQPQQTNNILILPPELINKYKE